LGLRPKDLVGNAHKPRLHRKGMAKSDSFFIRAQVEYDDAGTFNQTTVDLGSFVNLGIAKSTLLRIHRIQPQYFDSEGVFIPRATGVNKMANVAWQLTTQSQTAIQPALDKSVIAAGGLESSTDANSVVQHTTAAGSPNVDVWTNGYLVGVDSLFLGIDGNTEWSSSFTINLVLECTLENSSQASSTALALSQM
jgi:hypothetical protein